MAALLEHTGVAEPGALIAWAASAGKRGIAALAPAVLACAAAGDAAASAIRASAVAQLAELAECAARRAGLDSPHVALAGGLLQPGGPLRSDVIAAVRRALSQATLLDRQVDAALGAAMYAATYAAMRATDAGST